MTNPIPLFIFRANSAISIPDSQSPKKKRFLDGYNRRASTEIDEVDKYFAEETVSHYNEINVLDRFPNIRMIYK